MLKIYMSDGAMFPPDFSDIFLDFTAKDIGEAAEVIALALESGYSVYIEKNEK